MSEAALKQLECEVGRSHVSDWLTVDQAMIDAFAELTGDRQFIHVDPARAARTPFGGTVAHGFLLLSLLPRLQELSGQDTPEGLRMAVNYGFERVRFVAPVRAGARVRARFTLAEVEQKRPRQFQQLSQVTLELEGSEKPALTAEWIGLLFF